MSPAHPILAAGLAPRVPPWTVPSHPRLPLRLVLLDLLLCP